MTLNRLSLPQVMIGLARTTNYIENFSIGIAKKGSWHKSWTPLIPNSEIYLFLVGSQPEKWKIEIFVNPSQALYLTMVVTVVVIFVLSFVAGFLHWQEIKADRLDEEKNKGYVPINF